MESHKIQATEREVEGFFSVFSSFAIPQLGFAFWFSCTYMRHLVYSQPLLLLILGVWWVAIEEGGKKIMQGMKLIK